MTGNVALPGTALLASWSRSVGLALFAPPAIVIGITPCAHARCRRIGVRPEGFGATGGTRAGNGR